MYETDDTTTTPYVSANSQAAARLLELAATNADQLLAEAKAEADQLLAAARDEAQQVTDEAELARSQQTVDLERLRAVALADLANEKAHLGAAVDRLRELERDHVSRMRDYLTDELAHLDQLDRATDVAAVSDSAA